MQWGQARLCFAFISDCRNIRPLLLEYFLTLSLLLVIRGGQLFFPTWNPHLSDQKEILPKVDYIPQIPLKLSHWILLHKKKDTISKWKGFFKKICGRFLVRIYWHRISVSRKKETTLKIRACLHTYDHKKGKESSCDPSTPFLIFFPLPWLSWE